MLRAIVALLLLANAVFWGWSQGWLDDVVGVRSIGDREPQRLAQQLRPEIVRVLPGAGASAPDASASAAAAASVPATPELMAGDDQPTKATPATDAATSDVAATATSADSRRGAQAPTSDQCLEAGPFTATEVTAALAVVNRAAPAVGTVRNLTGPAPNTWIVYMGRYTDPEQMAEKQTQLNRIRGMKYERVRGIPELEPGFSLGRFADRASAQAALDEWNSRGVRTARVVALPPATVHRLRAEDIDAAMRDRLLALKAPALRDGFRPCEPLDGAASAPAR